MFVSVLHTTASRILAAVPVLLVVTIVAFGLLNAMPGDPAAVVAGEFASDAQVEAVREDLGLDRSIVHQAGAYLTDVAQGDFGRSYLNGQPVGKTILQALPVTLSLGFLSLVLATAVGLPLGILAATRPNGWASKIVNVVATLAIAVPPFVVGLGLIVTFALRWKLFPATGYTPLSDGLAGWLRSLTLPAIALALPSLAELLRQTRGAMTDVLEQDYISSATAGGVPRRVVVFRHALKNASLTIITIVGLQVGRLLGGAVIVESIFALPGFGSLTISAVTRRDIPLIQGCVIVSAIVVVAVNVVTDVAYSVVDPRQRR